MRKFSNRFGMVMASALLALAGAQSASAQVLYSTGFEATNGFVPGQLDGQQNWRSFGDPAGITVTPAAALSGALGVQISGTALRQSNYISDHLIASADTGFSWNGGTSRPLDFTADFRLNGPDGGTPEENDLLGLFEFYTQAGDFIGGVAFDYANGSAADFLTVYHLTVRIDPTRQVYDVFNDGDLLFTEAIQPEINYTGIAYPQISLFALNDPTKFDPAPFSLSFDNFSITSVPEPTSLAALAGSVALGLRRRRAH